MNKNHGMNWIRKTKRLALYFRGNCHCVVCGSMMDEAILTLDHIRSRSRGGTNVATNLVVMCMKCNSSKGESPLGTWLKKTRPEHWSTILKRVAKQASTPLKEEWLLLAKEMVDAQSWRDVLNQVKEVSTEGKEL